MTSVAGVAHVPSEFAAIALGDPSGCTDVGLTGLQEESLEVHRRNLDAALARLPAHTDFCWTAECALQVISFVENRAPRAGEALARALRDGRVGFSAVFAQLLTGLLDHETFARVLWPAGLFARERGLGYRATQLTDVPGQVLTFPTLLAASGVRYLASGRPHANDYLVGDAPVGVPRKPGIATLPDRPGAGAPGRTRRVVVNVDPRESDPARISSDEFQSAVTRP